MSQIEISELTMKLVTSDLAADPVEARLKDDVIRLSVGDSTIRFDVDDLDEIVTILERMRQEIAQRPSKPRPPVLDPDAGSNI